MRKLILCALLGLAACSNEIEMSKPGTSQEQWKKDDFECMREAYATGGGVTNNIGRYTREPNMPMYVGCMEARGYKRTG